MDRHNAGQRLIKVVWLAFWLFAATLLIAPLITLAAVFRCRRRRIYAIACLWARIICCAAGVKVLTRGRNQVDRRRSYVIVANHQSHFDSPALALGLADMQLSWIAKQELHKIPLFGHCLQVLNTIFIDRANRDAAIASIQKGLRQLPAGVSLIWFAEGTRSIDGRIGQFKKGAFMAALQSGTPVLPVTINGSRRVMPKGSVVFTPGRIELIVATPIETRGLAHHDLEKLMVQTRDVILTHFRQPTA
jgi:1-acyl-sn-glycerol-3-phosphate acyltransferase